jgi:hypothetical protein
MNGAEKGRSLKRGIAKIVNKGTAILRMEQADLLFNDLS